MKRSRPFSDPAIPLRPYRHERILSGVRSKDGRRIRGHLPHVRVGAGRLAARYGLASLVERERLLPPHGPRLLAPRGKPQAHSLVRDLAFPPPRPKVTSP